VVVRTPFITNLKGHHSFNVSGDQAKVKPADLTSNVQ
jgi:hypothetical protein